MTKRDENLRQRRLRMLYSLGDFQLALSAAAFLSELDRDQHYTKVELRRFRCFETTVIISYARPFSESAGGFPQLSLKMVGAELTKEQNALHERLLTLRNKVIAHSDANMMRMTSQANPIEIDTNFSYVFLHAVFDEGLTFIGEQYFELNELLHIVHGSLYKKLLAEAQQQPADFAIRKDYLRD